MTGALEHALRMDCRAAERLRAMGAAPPLPPPPPVPDLAAAVREAQQARTAPALVLGAPPC